MPPQAGEALGSCECPATWPVCVHGWDVSHKERTKYRLEGGDQGPEGAVVAPVLFLPLAIGPPPGRNRWPPPSSLGTDWCFV